MKRSDSLYMGLIFAGFVCSIAGLSLMYATVSDEYDPQRSMHTGFSTTPQTVSGEKYTVPQRELETACVGADCLPALENPTYVNRSVADTWLERGDLVIGVEQGNQSFAYPLRVLRWHPVVNTVIADQPVAVVYSPYAAHAAVLSRETDDGITTFGVSGDTLYGTFVLYDRDAASQWNPFSGEAIYGEAVSDRLNTYDHRIVRWGLWKDHHPNVSVLSRESPAYNVSVFEDDPYFAYRQHRDVPGESRGTAADLSPKELVLGVDIEDAQRAYPVPHVKGVEIVQDTVGGVPILLVQDEERGVINGFVRQVGEETRTFQLDESMTRLIDEETHSVWTLDGEAVEGPAAGTVLSPIDFQRMYWFSWARFNPDTTVYQP